MKQPRPYFFFLLFFFVLPDVEVFAQSLAGEMEARGKLEVYFQKLYGPDQELYHGEQYYDAFFQYRGDPYFPRDTFLDGSIVLQGIAFNEISFKYNCYSQFLVLEFSGPAGTYHQICRNPDGIDAFTLGEWHFTKLSLAENDSAFYQVIQMDPLYCYIHWSRNSIALNNLDRRYLYEFSDPKGEFYIQYQGKLFSLSGKKSFLTIFNESLAPGIKKYLREHRFSFKNTQPGEMEHLLAFVCSQLSSGASK